VKNSGGGGGRRISLANLAKLENSINNSQWAARNSGDRQNFSMGEKDIDNAGDRQKSLTAAHQRSVGYQRQLAWRHAHVSRHRIIWWR